MVGGGGSNDKSMFMYKRVANVDVATVEGNLGSATVTRVYSDKNLGFDAWTTDPSYFDSRTLVEPPANSIGIYAEDEGSKGDRPARFAAAGFEVVYGAEGSDDKMMVMPTSFTRQETPNGNGAEGFIYEKT